MTLTYKIQLVGSDGKPYEITYAGLRAALGVDTLNKREENRFTVLWDRIRDLEAELATLHTPRFEKLILDFVKANPDVKTVQFTYAILRKTKSRAERTAYYAAFEKLENSGAIIPTSHGPSLNRTWRLNEK